MTIDDTILILYLDGKLSGEAQAEVENWLGASAENERRAEELYFTLQAAKQLRVRNMVDVEKALGEFKVKTKRKDRGIRRGRLWPALQRIAGILFIPLFLIAGYVYMRHDGGGVQMVEVHTSPGVISAFDLPDGSRVWLNAGSSMKYAIAAESGKRWVELDGEGYFEVAKHRARPFVVQADSSCLVEVTGTSFNVCAYAEEDLIETTLTEGSVKLNILCANGKRAVRELKPDEKAGYEKHSGTVRLSTVQAAAGAAWRSGEVVFRHTPMEQVLRTLGRHYNVSFEVKDPEVFNAMITLRFREEPLSQVMDYLKTASGIHYTIHQPAVNSHDALEKQTIEITK
ncbi:MAG: DUF4974 domain-containing protein [Tannerellaceae bacterium]|jgi:ferric-dicitrate binding protein FerR (iron transport regulator)|nr:DUF4974 domain-containing protein [Tannerellaceae bacterium]